MGVWCMLMCMRVCMRVCVGAKKLGWVWLVNLTKFSLA